MTLLAERYVQAVLIISAVILLAPASGIAGGSALHRLYGVDIAEPNLLLLMRHRALLFALAGVPLLIAVGLPAWRLPSLIAATISVAAFIALAGDLGQLTPAIVRALRIDQVLVVLLLPAIAVAWWQHAPVPS